MVNLNERKRSVNVSKMSPEQIDKAVGILNKKIIEITERATKEVNELLNIYGLETKLQFLEPYPIKKDEVQPTKEKE